MNNFERASRLKLRFSTVAGNLTVEDLWDLPLIHELYASLDNVAKELNREVKGQEEESFVSVDKNKDTIPQLKLDIVKRIIEHKLSQIERNEKKAITEQKKARIMSILAEKEDDDLKGKSTEELKELLDEI